MKHAGVVSGEGASWNRRVRAVIALCFMVLATQSFALTRAEQREEFKSALSALEAGDRAEFFEREARLRNYVLHPHLRYALALDHVKRSPWPDARRAVLHFANAEPDSELSFSLVRAARRRLRDDGDWEAVLESANWAGAKRMPCLELRARVVLGRQTALRDADRDRWEQLSWPTDCRAAFDALLEGNRISGPDLWRRIAALMDRGRLDAARAFFPLLSNSDDALLQLWLDGHTAPAEHIDNSLIHANTAFNRTVARHFISRLARKDPVVAARKIAEFLRTGRYDSDTYADMLRTVAVRAAVDYHPDALKVLRAIPAKRHTDKTRAWWVRSALRIADWKQVRAAIDAMPADQQSESSWRYWGAQADRVLGAGETAQDTLKQLAEVRSYYGFLAADDIGGAYNLNVELMPRNADIRAELQTRADVQRAREYWVVGLDEWAQRAWQHLARNLSKQQFLELVTMASSWGWHDRALAGNASTPYGADLPLRFPFAFSDSVLRHARAQKLDPSWVYATARRESGFRPAVRSGAGAVGLMQLMPATAKSVAAARGEPRTGSLTDPDRNIQLGTHYLAQLRERFTGSAALVSAGYNAGPTRIKRWARDNWVGFDKRDAARWVETLPVAETRNYVQAVMAYATVYDWLANSHQDVRLMRRLGEIPVFD